MIPQIDPCVSKGIKRSSDSLINNFLCGLFGYLHIFIPKFWHLFGLMSDFSMWFPNHRYFRNSRITTSLESSANTVMPGHIGMLACY